VVFFEKDKSFAGPSTPTNFNAIALDSNQVKVTWNAVTNADAYNVYRGVSSNRLSRLATTQISSYIDTNVANGTVYWYAVSSVDTTRIPNESKQTAPLPVFVHSKARLISATFIKDGEVSVRFSQDMGSVSPNPSSFVVTQIGVPASVVVVSEREMLLNFQREIPEGTYRVSVNNLTDAYGTPVDTSGKVAFNVALSKGKSFYLASFRLVSQQQIDLEFSDAVDNVTASNPANYKIEPGITVAAAAVDVTQKNLVHLSVGPAKAGFGALGKQYVVAVTNVKSASGVLITTGAGSTAGVIINKDDLSGVFAYPNPVRFSENKFVTFANLTQKATITIWTLSGQKIKTLEEVGGNGGVEWFLDDDSGNSVSSGVYVFRVTGQDRFGNAVEEKVGKVAILR
jgi:hypothetical protein